MNIEGRKYMKVHRALSICLVLAITACMSVFSVEKAKSEVLVVIYMSARNDLLPFVGKSIKQLQALGSNERVKLFIHLDMQRPGEEPITKHFVIEKNKAIQLGSDMLMDSGQENTLVHAVECAYERFPAEELVLIIWNHGTGAIEPEIHGVFRSSDLYRFNDQTGKVEMRHAGGLLDLISNGEVAVSEPKGICFDDAHSSYLTIAQFTQALATISTKIIKKKIKILACDACHMAAADVFIGLEPYVHYFIGSEEVELGSGYKYDILLEPLLKGTMHCEERFARHIVSAYEEAYTKIMPELTHSAIDLTHIAILERNIDQVAQTLIWGLEKQKNKSVKEAIRLSKHKNACTRFKEPTYIDLGHFYANLLTNIANCELTEQTSEFKSRITMLLKEGAEIIHQVVIANATGDKMKKATGIAICFPEFVIHKSYHNNPFAAKTHWLRFLKKYLGSH